MTMTTLLRNLSSSLLLSSCIACSSAEPQDTVDPSPAATPTTRQMDQGQPLLRVDVVKDHTVTFYEPAPGNLLLVESMTPSQQSILREFDQPDAIAVFRRIQPDRAIPAVLLAAYDRARSNGPAPAALTQAASSRGGGEPSLAGPQGEGIVPTVSSSSAANFVNNLAGCSWGSGWSFCSVNWANGYYAYSTASSATCIIDHYAGNGITVQLTAGTTSLPTYQGVGTVQTYSWGLVSGRIVRRLDIQNAAGDSFHVGCRWTL